MTGAWWLLPRDRWPWWARCRAVMWAVRAAGDLALHLIGPDAEGDEVLSCWQDIVAGKVPVQWWSSRRIRRHHEARRLRRQHDARASEQGRDAAGWFLYA